MHELSVCQSLLSQVEQIAASHGADAVHLIKVKAGPLSGIEPPLLQQAFSIARSGTVAREAKLEIEASRVVVRCRSCNHRSEVTPNRLLCENCGNWQVYVLEGEELMLMSVELSGLPASPHGPRQENDTTEESRHV